MPVAAPTAVAAPSWSLRWALLPALAGIGIPALLHQAGREADGRGLERPARWALAWCMWATVATLLAPRPSFALWGEYRVGTGLVFALALAGAWAIGARGGRTGARWIANSILAGCVVNALLAVAEQLVDLSAFGVSPYQGRSAGLYGNPVYLAELLCGGLWLALARVTGPAVATPSPLTAAGRSVDGSGTAGAPALGRWVRRSTGATPTGRSVGAAIGGAVIAAGIQLSGSRAALVVAVAAGAVAAIRSRGPRRLLVIAAVGSGLALGVLVATVAGGATTGTDRVGASGTSGYAARTESWKGGLSSLAQRPLWGWGPGGFLAAAGPRRSLAIARDQGPNGMFADAHDAVVEVAVTTGVVGLALAVAWGWTAVACCRRRSGLGAESLTGDDHRGLLGFAGLVMAVTLVEPLHPGVTPLALLALGAAGALGRSGGGDRLDPPADATGGRVGPLDPPADAPDPRAQTAGAGATVHRPARRRGFPALAGRAVVALSMTIGLVTTAWLTVGLVDLHQAEQAGDPAAAVVAARRLPPLGEPDAVVAALVAFDGISHRDNAELARSRAWLLAAARRDPADPLRWNNLGDARAHAGEWSGAVGAYRSALADDPWSLRAMQGLLRVGSRGDLDPGTLDRLRTRLALMAPGVEPVG